MPLHFNGIYILNDISDHQLQCIFKWYWRIYANKNWLLPIPVALSPSTPQHPYVLVPSQPPYTQTPHYIRTDILFVLINHWPWERPLKYDGGSKHKSRTNLKESHVCCGSLFCGLFLLDLIIAELDFEVCKSVRNDLVDEGFNLRDLKQRLKRGGFILWWDTENLD